MNKSQRIYLGVNETNKDKYVKVRLEQNVDTLEFLSLKVSTKDIYQNFNADYGVIVGRVIANNGIGIPNARISIFIPLSDDDKNNGEIVAIYPYETPRDKNNEGKRYNLLPRVSKINPNTGKKTPNQPFGSFPTKEEILTNDSFLNVYNKYYKYTALTNDSGDYMIFGVPTGTQTVHMSVDITDIGEYSMTPAAMVTNLGYSSNLFSDGNSRIKPSSDLNDLPHIETQEISVNVIPFWGDVQNYEIGITRQDFRIRATLVNTFVVFGSAFTDGDNSLWGDNYVGGNLQLGELFRIKSEGNLHLTMQDKRIGNITEKIYYYPNTVSDTDIDNDTANPVYEGNMLVLDPSEYSFYKKNGNFVFIISCNRDKVISDEFGNKIPVLPDSEFGVYTKFRGFITLEITVDEVPMDFDGSIGAGTKLTPVRYKLKFPQHAKQMQGLNVGTDDFPEGKIAAEKYNDNWRKQHYTFEANKFYSFARFHPTVFNNSDVEDDDIKTSTDSNSSFYGFFITDAGDEINNPYNKDQFNCVGLIVSTNTNLATNNYKYELPTNTKSSAGWKCFGANWLNLSIYLPQTGYLIDGVTDMSYVRCNTHFQYQYAGYHDDHDNAHFLEDNNQVIGAGIINTKWFPRTDLNWTDIIEVDYNDIKNLLTINSSGVKVDQYGNVEYYDESGNIKPAENILLTSKFRNGINKPSGWDAACPIRGGMVNGNVTFNENGNVTSNPDTNSYIFRGKNPSDCIGYLYELGIVK